jgi:hypothetical protein
MKTLLQQTKRRQYPGVCMVGSIGQSKFDKITPSQLSVHGRNREMEHQLYHGAQKFLCGGKNIAIKYEGKTIV